MYNPPSKTKNIVKVIRKGMAKRATIYSVSQINSLIKVALEEKLPPRLIIRGEISDWKHHSSGHCYFSLKDEGGILPCVMWASSFKKTKFSPDDGMEVLASGHIDVYTVGGKYQLYVDKLDPAGVGALQLAFEQMVRKLRAEGLFDEEHKKPLPAYPMRIGILTSESGAALHDITDSVCGRWPCAKLFLYPVPVQGEGAAGKIAAALRDVNRRNKELKLDVLIVGRGGGSLEDLWAFNEEVLARAIFDSHIPVISAVGHEVDTTIADLAADARASTPTQAGVVAVPEMKEVQDRLAAVEQHLKNQLVSRFKHAAQDLRIILASSVFRNPLSIVRNAEQQVDELATDLTEAVQTLLTDAREILSVGYERIVRIEPHRLLGQKTVELNNWQSRMDMGIGAVLNKSRVQLTAQANRLEALNPKSVLHRGYSITTNKKTGLLVKRAKDVRPGDEMMTELAEENLIESKVTKT